ncbi:MAG: type II toxin-antitoxin system RelE/ParE family toxin, partial [Rhodospirillales bacterium]|nr:type II toxin-antitoxin system RelE/ParE family toxin [Rhodospirillales bacterium]
MVMKVRLHPRARRDLAEIRDYLRENGGPASAERVRRHSKERIERLGRHAELGIASSEPRIRVLSPTRFPDRIYYTVIPIPPKYGPTIRGGVV